MQGFKKVLVALLVVATILGTIGPVFAAPQDVAGTKYEDAAVRLLALKIFTGDDKGNFNPDQPISRAEAVAVVVRALGLEDTAKLMAGTTKFADVNADAGLKWATGYINLAVGQGIVNGYPDGRFGGRDSVTYAQLAKMMLYAMNYGVTIQGGVWPTAVLAKAADLGMTDGMAVVADAPILRGDAAKLVDNSLEVRVLVQKGFGSSTYYEEGDELITKLGLTKVEGQVDAVPTVAKALDSDEVQIDGKTYTVLQGVDAASLFGLEVKAWVNDDDEITFIEPKTSAKDIYVDTVDADSVANDTKVALHVLDEKVSLSKDAVIYVNNSKVDLNNNDALDAGDLKQGDFGRFVKKGNEIVFANLYRFDYDGVVTDVSDKVVKYFGKTNKVRTLDLSDVDAIHVYNADLTETSLDKVEKDDVIYWFEDSDEYYIVVSKAKAEGTLEKVKSEKVTIAGKNYDMLDQVATYSLNADEDVAVWDKNHPDYIDDLDGEEVVALLDLKGHVRHLRGDTKKTSGTQYGVVVGAPSDGKVTVFTKDGEEVTYDIDKKTDWGQLKPSDKKPLTKYYGTDTTLGYFVMGYKLNGDGEVAASEGTTGPQNAKFVTGTSPAEDAANADYDNLVKSTKDARTVDWNGNTYYIDDSTVLIRTVNSKGELDPEVIAWDDFKDSVLTDVVANQAVVFGTANQAAKAIFFVNKAFAGAQADTFYAVVSDKWRAGGDDVVELDTFDGAKKEYVLASGSASKGSVIAYQLNAKGEVIVLSSPAAVEATVVAIDGYYVDLQVDSTQAKVYRKIDSGAVVYALDSEGTLKVSDAANVELGDRIVCVDDGYVIKAAKELYSKTGKVTAVAAGTVTIDGTSYPIGTAVIADNDSTPSALEVGDVVKYVLDSSGKLLSAVAQ